MKFLPKIILFFIILLATTSSMPLKRPNNIKNDDNMKPLDRAKYIIQMLQLFTDIDDQPKREEQTSIFNLGKKSVFDDPKTSSWSTSEHFGENFTSQRHLGSDSFMGLSFTGFH